MRIEKWRWQLSHLHFAYIKIKNAILTKKIKRVDFVKIVQKKVEWNYLKSIL